MEADIVCLARRYSATRIHHGTYRRRRTAADGRQECAPPPDAHTPRPRPAPSSASPAQTGAAARRGCSLARGAHRRRTRVHITPHRRGRLDGLDGLIVGGGADVDPKLYGQIPRRSLPEAKHPERIVASASCIGLVLFPLTWLASQVAAGSLREKIRPGRPRPRCDWR